LIDYYKLNRLYKALALQKYNNTNTNTNSTGKNPHQRRAPNHIYQQQNHIPSFSPSSPPTPTPMNIDRLAPFYAQQSFVPLTTTAIGSRKSKY
jgi:hypothetical protein